MTTIADRKYGTEEIAGLLTGRRQDLASRLTPSGFESIVDSLLMDIGRREELGLFGKDDGWWLFGPDGTRYAQPPSWQHDVARYDFGTTLIGRIEREYGTLPQGLRASWDAIARY